MTGTVFGIPSLMKVGLRVKSITFALWEKGVEFDPLFKMRFVEFLPKSQ